MGEKSVVVENLDTQLRKLLVATEALVDYRKNLSGHTYSLSKSLGLLGSAEDNSKLATAIAQLAEVEEKVEKVHEQQAKDDFFLLSELVHDHIGLVGAVKDAFSERVKAWQSWQAVQRDLNKRRENKVKAELAGKQDRVNQLRQEIAENERQLDMAQENFEKIQGFQRHDDYLHGEDAQVSGEPGDALGPVPARDQAAGDWGLTCTAAAVRPPVITVILLTTMYFMSLRG